LVDAVHAHPRHGPRPVVGPAVLTVPPFDGCVRRAAVSCLVDPTGMCLYRAGIGYPTPTVNAPTSILAAGLGR
jgi:hypothetical protein